MPSSGLRSLILVNAGFSLSSGMVLATVPSTVEGWLGIDAHGWIRLIGIVLTVHGLMLGWTLTRQALVTWAWVNIWAIAPYPLIMVGLVVFDVIASTGGKVLALIDGAIVAVLAVGQARLVVRDVEKLRC